MHRADVGHGLRLGSGVMAMVMTTAAVRGMRMSGTCLLGALRVADDFFHLDHLTTAFFDFLIPTSQVSDTDITRRDKQPFNRRRKFQSVTAGGVGSYETPHLVLQDTKRNLRALSFAASNSSRMLGG